MHVPSSPQSKYPDGFQKRLGPFYVSSNHTIDENHVKGILASNFWLETEGADFYARWLNCQTGNEGKICSNHLLQFTVLLMLTLKLPLALSGTRCTLASMYFIVTRHWHVVHFLRRNCEQEERRNGWLPLHRAFWKRHHSPNQTLWSINGPHYPIHLSMLFPRRYIIT